MQFTLSPGILLERSEEILMSAEDPAYELIEAALAAGGKDNISVIVAGVD